LGRRIPRRGEEAGFGGAEMRRPSWIAVLLLGVIAAGVVGVALMQGGRRERSAATASAETAPRVRSPAVAGTFYPSSPDRLRADVRLYLQEARGEPEPGDLVALIVPHAGYEYSGLVAGYAYRELEGRSYDTVVVIGDRVLGKPASPGEAVEMLRALSGRSHRVYTGLALVRDELRSVAHEVTEVTMRTLGDDEIAAYVATGEPRDKAGGYAIQGKGAVLVSGICGDYYNVVGLPLARLAEMLKEFGLRVL